MRGVERSCFERGYSLVLCNTEGDEQRMNRNLETLMQKRVDGLLLLCTETHQPSREIMQRYPTVPTVMMDWAPFDGDSDLIQDNSLLGGDLATQYLIDKGHTRIACITGPLDKTPARLRLEGYRAAMKRAGLSIGGWFPKGLSGFFAGFQIAVFAFVGIELVGTTAAETKDPEKSLPRAINSIPIRIIMFYVFALIVIMSVTPWSSVVPEKSPFVELFVLVGLPAAASVINFVVLTSAASSANSGVFSTSRMLFGLAQEGVAPKAFAKLSKRAVPAKGLTFSCICLLGGVVMLYVNPSVIGAFTMITTVSAILFMFVWTIILCSYLVYRKQRPHLHEKSIYKMPLGKLMCWVCMAFFVFVIVLLTLEDDTRQALLVTPLWFIALGLGWLFIGKKRAAELRK